MIVKLLDFLSAVAIRLLTVSFPDYPSLKYYMFPKALSNLCMILTKFLCPDLLHAYWSCNSAKEWQMWISTSSLGTIVRGCKKAITSSKPKTPP